ncbi:MULTISPECIES: Crp/Fnr family transcriptional regulator [Rhizobium]|jgi:CRP/FNR family transcriptional regulator|uniref:Crp/Fnr family transcriptional regulator n=7 Tax=Rhizobium TaxID=379 RepID=A0A192TLN7_9HYPH|nr:MULTISPECIES: Crp/Fnr family transcriptional regulator [Rhizobium]ACE93969.1 transcriptional regulator protein, Fnr/CRP family [Rhizobium etli CIAT 652]UWU38719.1 Crp/Fnr family transcriptional regulator [Rhizobium leguminosarum bv. phaseoli]ANK88500.1 transcriptional activator FnrN 2 [Rhizobium sp. N731]ANL18751.1 transcriptional activator FnrN 2 [Rhizobium sp. N1314]ANL37332.1 transcriptional activator FnrN 2 [Rhizobium phaseoli]
MDVARSEVLVIGTSVACRSCQARHGVVCGALSAGQLSELGRHSLRRKVDAGCEIIAQGSENSFYSNITRGVVKLCKVMSDGRQQIVGLQFAPDFVGRPFVRESTLSAEAATDAEICVFPRNLLERMILETRELQRSLHAQALNELDAAREWMLTLGRRTAEEKVASLLHLIAAHAETATSTAFDLPLSRAEIADFLGLTIETVSRQLTRLRKEGVIRIENIRHITVPDMDALAKKISG